MKDDDYRLYLMGGLALMLIPVAVLVITGSVLPTPVALTLAVLGGAIMLTADAAYRESKDGKEAQDG